MHPNPIPDCDGTHGGCGRCVAIDQEAAEEREFELAAIKANHEHARRLIELEYAQRINILKYVVVAIAVAGFFIVLAIGAYTGNIK
jgi:hypothetical protein